MKRQIHHKLVRVFVAGITVNILLAGLTQTAWAELREINDTELGSVVGQSLFRVDMNTENNIKTTRASLAVDVETQINVGQATFGQIDKPNTAIGADIDANQLSLERIDGNNVQSFLAKNPYLEVVQDNGRMVGLRIGFEDAQGSLLGSINSFSGNLGMTVVDADGVVHPTFLLNDQNQQVDSRATHVGTIIVPPPVVQPGDFPLQASNAATSDPAFPDDPQLAADVAPPPIPELPPELVTNKISNFQTFDIGKTDAAGNAQAAKDFFISIQAQSVLWKGAAGGPAIKAVEGFHLNLPQGSALTLDQFRAGVPRADGGFVSRGTGLF